MGSRIDLSPIRNAACRTAQEILTSKASNAPEETFYGFAMCPDNDVQSVYLMANTEERLEHPGDRFCVTEWAFSEENPRNSLDGPMGDAWNSFAALAESMDEKTYRVQFSKFRKQVLSVLTKGLSDFRESSATERFGGADFAILIYFPDPDDPNEALEIARILNSPRTFRAFSEGYSY